MRSQICFLLPLICCIVPACSKQVEWQTYENADWSFRVDFPSKPRLSSAGGMEDDEIKVNAWDDSDDIEFVVRVRRFEPTGKSNSEEVTAMLQERRFAKPISTESKTVGDIEVMEVIQPHESAGPKVEKCWYIATPGHWYYVIAVANSQEQLSSPKIVKFLHSFKLLGNQANISS